MIAVIMDPRLRGDDEDGLCSDGFGPKIVPRVSRTKRSWSAGDAILRANLLEGG